jgi:hypothetical protein
VAFNFWSLFNILNNRFQNNCFFDNLKIFLFPQEIAPKLKFIEPDKDLGEFFIGFVTPTEPLKTSTGFLEKLAESVKNQTILKEYIKEIFKSIQLKSAKVETIDRLRNHLDLKELCKQVLQQNGK